MKAFPFLALILVSALWGAHAVVGKAAEQSFSPLGITVWRFTLGAILYIPLLPRLVRVFRMGWRVFWQLAFTGVCWAVLYPLFYYQSLHLLSPVESLLLVNTSPLMAALLGWLIFKERLNSLESVGIFVSFLGVVALVAGQWTSGVSLTGVCLALVAALAFATYSLSSRRLFMTLPLYDVLMATSVWSVIFLWAIVLFSGSTRQVVGELAHLNPSGWEQLLYIVLVVSTVAYVLYGYGLKRLPAGVGAALTFYPQVLFVALIQWIWAGTTPAPSTVLSAVLILGGTALMGRARKRQTESG